jgi:3-deoxy-D-manno-octulosonate 8-phosphate phosphatase KdsC-like HAD superfamily phosphatase
VKQGREKAMTIKLVSISDVQEGMELAKALVNEKGMTLCAEGTQLTTSLISRFERMGIEAVYINSQEQMSEEDYLAKKQHIEKHYSKVGDDPFFIPLKEVILERLEAKR